MRRPRWELVKAKRHELLAAAEEYGAVPILLTGSVARGQEAEEGDRPDKPSASDIDFYVPSFHRSGVDWTDRANANALVKRFRDILAPYPVDIRPLPGWLIDAPQLAGFERDAVPLEDLA